MIPDQPLNFNHFGAGSNFDDQEVRLRHLLSQGATPTFETGRHQLLVCPVCKQPWYKAGRSEYPRLTPEQLVFLGALQQVDIQALYLLPKVLCTICSALHLGGMFSAEAYARHCGYRFLWESVSARRLQLLAIVCRGEELTLDALMQMIPERFAEPLGEMRSMLAWLETCPSPESVQILSDAQCQHLAHHCPPGSAVEGDLYHWRGYAWETPCPLLGGHALVLLAVTTRSDALPPFASLRMGWGVLARAMRAVL